MSTISLFGRPGPIRAFAEAESERILTISEWTLPYTKGLSISKKQLVLIFIYQKCQ